MKNQPMRFMLLSMLAVLLGTSLPAVAQTDYAIRTSALSEHDANAPIGFGAGVTGSGNANPITVTTRDALITALSVTDAQTIYVDGTIEFSGSVNISGVKNKTIIGLPGATLSNPTHSDSKSESGILTLTNCQNIIIRNLIFKGAGAFDIDGNDNLTLTSSQNIWIDHCDFQDGVDGNLDCNNGSDNICVSWCRFSYKIVPWSGGSGGSNDHRFSNLWGSGDNVSADEGNLNTTFVNCWWDEGCKQRMPRIRFGQVHLLNCLYNSSVADYCIGAGYRSNAYVENCYFDTSYGAAWQKYASGSYTDYNITLTGNYGAADEQSQSGSISYFTPSYDYTAYNASDVKSTLTAANGAGATLQFGEDEEAGDVVYSWTPTAQIGGTAVASDGQSVGYANAAYTTIRLNGKVDYSTNIVTITLNNALKAGDIIHVTAYRNKNDNNKASGFKAKFDKGGEVASSTGLEFVNIDTSDASAGDSNRGSEPNTCTFDVPEAAIGSTVITMTRSHSSTNLFITKLEITTTTSGGEEPEPDPEPATWRDFEAVVNNQTGTLLTTEEQVQGTAVSFGIAVDEEGHVSRVATDDGSSIATISGTYHSEHGMTGMQVVTAVPGAVTIQIGTCTYSGNTITVTNSKNEKVIEHAITDEQGVGERQCWKNNRDNIIELNYNGEATTLTISGMGYCPFIAVKKAEASEEPDPDPTPSDEMTITWSMADGSSSTAIANPAEAIQTTSWSVASDLAINSSATGTYGTSTYTLFTRNGTEKLDNNRSKLNNSYVEFLFKPAAGITITPTALSFDIIKLGTGDPAIWVECVQGATTTSIAENVTINRDNAESPSVHHDYDLTALTDIAATTDATAIRIYIGKLANTKQVAIANVVVSGTVSGSVQQFTTVYDLAAAMMTAPKNIEGFASSLAATSTEAGANATDILVDATSGKLGKNNADWAQLNEGTILTIPGVPEGAQVTFALYNTTALTINGVAYTNGQTYTATKNENLTMTCTTGGYIKSITVVGSAFVYVPETEGYTNTWQFGKSNGAPEFALQGSPEYNYEVGDYSLIINTAAGKLNNASRTDQWAQCNNGTLFKVPMYAGSKLSWGRYNSGSDAGFVVDGKLFNEYYIASEESTVEFKALGISYLSFIKIEPATLYEISGTITGGNIDGSTITLTAAGNGETYSAAIAEGAFTLKVPADTYTFDLSEDAPYVVSTPENLLINADGSIGEITITAAEPQDVTGLIANAPAEAFTLTFTGASHNKQVELAANATSFATTLDPDTYVISSSVGTLSPLSVESFKVLKDAVSHNIYFPEEAVPAATQQNITVDNTAAVAANVYNTVTDALAAAKAGNISNPVITLTSGQTYQEQVIVDQAGVTLKTSGAEKATITFYYGIGYTYYSLNEKGYYDKDRAMTRNSILMKDPSRWGTTVLVTNKGNNFKAENIIFENSFNQRYTAEEVTDGVRPNGCQGITYDRTLTSEQGGFQAADAKAVTERAAALAFENNPTGCQLYDCILIGSQDTYYTSGIIYNKNCDIVGNTDYIFGGGTVVFDNCNLVIGGYSDKETSAYITAQKGSAGDHYIFRDCTVKKGDRKYTLANLGRDWGGPDATVYYFNLKNEMGNKLEYKWTNMGDGVSAGTANLHIYDFDPAINANYNTTGANGANVNGVLADDVALSLYAEVVASMGFTPERIYEDKVELSESSAYNICHIAASDNVERDVTLTRTLAAGQWTAIVLPFSMTSEQIADAFGAGAKVAELSSTTNTALYFTTVDAMEANQPYIIQVSDDFTAANINGVTITKVDPTVVFGGWTANGTYTAGKIPAGSHYISNNMVKKAEDDTNDITAMSVYFTNTFADAVELYVDGISTCIKDVKPGQPAGDIVYTLQGVRVEKAQKDLYIVNGRKAIVK